MLRLAKKIKDNLSEQLRLYEYMDRLTQEKKEIIIKGDAESLAELDKIIEAVICQILEVEQNRLKMLEGQALYQAKLSNFINHLDPITAKPLLDLRAQLVSVMRNIQKVNDINVYLIKSSIKWVEHSIATIVDVLAPESAAYSANGRALAKSTYNLSTSSLVEHDA